MNEKEKFLHNAAEQYADKWWGRNSTSKTIAAMAFRAGAIWSARQISKDMEIADATGKSFPIQDIRSFINSILRSK